MMWTRLLFRRHFAAVGPSSRSSPYPSLSIDTKKDPISLLNGYYQQFRIQPRFIFKPCEQGVSASLKVPKKNGELDEIFEMNGQTKELAQQLLIQTVVEKLELANLTFQDSSNENQLSAFENVIQSTKGKLSFIVFYCLKHEIPFPSPHSTQNGGVIVTKFEIPAHYSREDATIHIEPMQVTVFSDRKKAGFHKAIDQMFEKLKPHITPSLKDHFQHWDRPIKRKAEQKATDMIIAHFSDLEIRKMRDFVQEAKGFKLEKAWKADSMLKPYVRPSYSTDALPIPSTEKVKIEKIPKDFKPYPTLSHYTEIVESIENHPITIIQAEPGAGKVNWIEKVTFSLLKYRNPS
jgi:hypothetical protein